VRSSVKQVATIAHLPRRNRVARLYPELLEKLRRNFRIRLICMKRRAPKRKITLARDVDLAITVVEKKSRAGIEVRPYWKLPVDSARPQKVEAGRRRRPVEARQN